MQPIALLLMFVPGGVKIHVTGQHGNGNDLPKLWWLSHVTYANLRPLTKELKLHSSKPVLAVAWAPIPSCHVRLAVRRAAAPVASKVWREVPPRREVEACHIPALRTADSWVYMYHLSDLHQTKDAPSGQTLGPSWEVLNCRCF